MATSSVPCWSGTGSSALKSALLLGGLSFVAYWLAHSNGAPQWAFTVALAAPAALFVWSAWNPTSSERRLQILEGVYFLVRFAMLLLIFTLVLSSLLSVGFHLSIWVQRNIVFFAIAAGLWGAPRVLDMVVVRSNRIMGDRSVLRT